MANYSKSALAHVQALRRERREPAFASWFDVAAAYDAGMKHALEARSSARRILKQMRRADQVSGDGA